MSTAVEIDAVEVAQEVLTAPPADSVIPAAEEPAAPKRTRSEKVVSAKSISTVAVKPPKPATAAAPKHPKVGEMVTSAVGELKERGGSSLQAIKKYMTTTYNVDTVRLAPRIRKSLMDAVDNGTLVQTKGIGASGSFKLVTKTKAATVPKKQVATSKNLKVAAPKNLKVAAPKKLKGAAPKKLKGATPKKQAARPKKVAVPAKLKTLAKRRPSPKKVAALKITPKKALKSAVKENSGAGRQILIKRVQKNAKSPKSRKIATRKPTRK